jgi:PncC family amidohydrolase
MRIIFAVSAAEAACCEGLTDYLYLIAQSLRRKGIEAEITPVYDIDTDLDTVAVTFGEAALNNQFANIPLSGGLCDISNSIYESLCPLFYNGGTVVTAKLFGVTEVEHSLDLIEKNFDGVKIFNYSRGLITTIKIFCKEPFGSAVTEVFSLYNKNIYADEDVDLSKRLLQLLSVRGKTLSVAESLTGGLVCSYIVDNSGASEYFNEGIVSYSNKSKVGRLSVDGQTIKNYGAVSSQTAYEMAAGLLSAGDCDISIATTGIAGPDGATLSKPLGLTYIAIGTPQKVHIFKHIFTGGRAQVKRAAAQAAIFYAIKVLKDNSIDYQEITIN